MSLVLIGGIVSLTASSEITAEAASNEGLIAYYTFDTADYSGANTSGNRKVTDKSGNSNDATLYWSTGTTSSTTGMVGQSLRLNNANGVTGTAGAYALLPSSLLSGTDDFTVSTLVKFANHREYAPLFSFGSAFVTTTGTNTAPGAYWTFTPGSSDSPIRGVFESCDNWNTGTDNFKFDQQDGTTGEWVMLTVTRSGSAVTIYRNGAPVASGTSSYSPKGRTLTRSYIGKSQWDNTQTHNTYNDPYLDAELDEFKVYSRALTSAEVLYSYNEYWGIEQEELVYDDAASGAPYLMSYTMPTTTSGTDNSGTNEDMTYLDDSLHYAYSEDGSTWTPLNDNKGVLFVPHSAARTADAARQYRNPFIFKTDEGPYIMVATSVRCSGDATYYPSILYWSSADLINWTDYKTITLETGTPYPSVPQIKKVGSAYSLYWRRGTSGTTYRGNTISYLGTLTGTAANYTGSDYNAAAPVPSGVTTAGAPTGAVIGGIISIPAARLEKLKDALATPYMDDVTRSYGAGEKTVAEVRADLPKHGTLSLADGTQYQYGEGITWTTLPTQANLNTPGTYPIEGTLDYTYTNYIQQDGADPSIFYKDGYYYFSSSHMVSGEVPRQQYDRIIIKRATTIDGLRDSTDTKTIYSRTSTTNDFSPHIWAPEVHYVFGRWVVYFAMPDSFTNANQWAIKCQVASLPVGTDIWADNATWTIETVQTTALANDTCAGHDFDIDMTTFDHGGVTYAVFSCKYDDQARLKIARMSDYRTLYDTTAYPIVELQGPDTTIERRVNLVVEAPTVIAANGKVWLSYSSGSTNATYSMGVLWADEDADLLRKSSWHKLPYPLMVSGKAGSQWGPGHSTFVMSEAQGDGVSYPLLSYHARPVESYADELHKFNRYARIGVVYFHRNGDPYFGVPPADGPLPGLTVKGAITVTPVASSLSVSPEEWTFGQSYEGYDAPDAKQFTVTNASGGVTASGVTASLSDAAWFEVSGNLASAKNIASPGTNTFSVRPKTGAPVGVYSADVYVKVGDVTYLTVPLTFTVTEQFTVTPAVKAWTAAAGYSVRPSAQEYGVANVSGAAQTIASSVAGTGGIGEAAFDITVPSWASFTDGTVKTVTIQPKAGVAPGTHSVRITLTSGTVVKYIDASFVVANLEDLPQAYYYDVEYNMYELTAGQTLTATAYFSNSFPNAETLSGRAFLALYNGDDRLVKISPTDFTVDPAATNPSVTAALALPAAIPAGAYAKLYFWEKESYKPIGESASLGAKEKVTLPTANVWYEFNGNLNDSSGNGRNGTMNNGATGTNAYSNGVLTLGNNELQRRGGAGDWVKVPNAAITGDTLTISLYTRQSSYTTMQNAMTFAIQQDAPKTNAEGALGYYYLCFSTTGARRVAITTDTYGAEQGLTDRGNVNNSGVWEHWVVTVTPSSIRMRIYGANGAVLTDQTAAVTNKISDVTGGAATDTANSPNGAWEVALGRACYANDWYFRGDYGDFRIYDGELTPEQIELLKSDILGTEYTDTRGFSASITADWTALADAMPANGSTLVNNVALPTAGANGSSILWKTSFSPVISAAGAVRRPDEGMGGMDVALVAIITNGAERLTRVFKYSVPDEDPLADIQAELDHITLVGDLASFSHNAELKSFSDYGCEIVWASSDETAMTDAGINEVTSGSKAVALTVTVSKMGHSLTKTFNLTVKPATTEAYVLAYFCGNKTQYQKNYLAVSSDGLTWTWLNNNTPIFEISDANTVYTNKPDQNGTGCVRDQYIVQHPITGKYYMMGTDLDANYVWTNNALWFWESDDLINWHSQTRWVTTGGDRRGQNIVAANSPYTYTANSNCAWAPEAVWDADYTRADGGKGAFMLFWSANTRGNTDYNHLVYSYTYDFTEFTAPQRLFQVGTGTNNFDSVIDGNIIYENGVYYMFFRFGINDAGNSNVTGYNFGSPDNGIVRVQSTSLPGSAGGDWNINWTNPVRVQGNTGIEGPNIYKVNGTTNNWRMCADWFGSGYYTQYSFTGATSTTLTDLRSQTNIDESPLPGMNETANSAEGRVRHGSVIPIPQSKYNELYDNYRQGGSAFSAAP